MEIVFDNVSYQNGDSYILKDINCKFENGKISAIIGPTGSGKTTLIKMINDLYKPTKGEIKIDNLNINENIDKFRHNIGFMFQFPEQQFFNKTVKEELEFNLKIFNYRINEIDKRVKDSLKMVGLNESYLNLNPLSLSNGDRRKIALASLLIYNPKIIILDEPTIGIDDSSKRNFIKLIKMLKNRYNKTIIIVSHDIELIHKLADNIIVLNEGNIVSYGNKYDVFKNGRQLKKYGLLQPKIILFSDKVYNKKNIKLGYRDEINDLIKDIYRNV